MALDCKSNIATNTTEAAHMAETNYSYHKKRATPNLLGHYSEPLPKNSNEQRILKAHYWHLIR
jgi:hypothetical protein